MTSLLQTKLHPARAQAGLVERERIMTALDEIMTRRLTLISASAGFGKTTAIVAWLERATVRSAWLSLDAGDNSLERFVHYFVAALQTVDSTAGASVRALIESGASPSATAMIDSIINDIARRDDPLVLVLDDYHVITDTDINDAMSYLLEHAPEGLHLVMTSRADPSFALSRLRVRKQLLEIRASDLRFSVDESAALFRETLPLELSDEHVAALQKKTEGWIAGLQMAGLSLRGRDDVDGFIADFTGADRYVLDYLIEEVLNNQPAATQQVMLELSVLDRFNGPLCEAVTGHGDGASALASLEESNLFLIPLDNRREWYRYHKLFGDLLQHRLRQTQPERVAELHKRASDWFEQRDRILESAVHALHSGDRRLLRAKIERSWRVILRDGTRAELRQLVTDAFTREEILQSARLSMIRTMTSFFERDFDLMRSTLQATEQLIELETDAPDYRDVAGQQLMMRGVYERDNGENSAAVEYTRRAFEALPHRSPSDPDYMYYTSEAMLLNVLATTYDQMREYDRAETTLHEAIRYARAADDDVGVVTALGNLGKMLVRRGDFDGALRYADEIEAYRGRPAMTMDRAEAIPYQIRARIAAERHQIATAIEQATMGLAAAGPPDQHLELLRTLFIAHEAAGDLDAVERVVEKAERVPLNQSIARLAIVSQLMRVQLHVRRSQYDAAADVAMRYAEWLERWSSESAPEINDTNLPVVANGLFNRAHIELGRGNAQSAIDAVERAIGMFRTSEQLAVVVEAHVLHAVARERARDIEGAQAALTSALEIAAPAGIIRAFVAEGAPVARLVQQLVTKRRTDIGSLPSEYLRALIDALRLEEVLGAAPVQQARRLVTDEIQLTSREQEILNLLAMGYPNRKIADKLYLSVNTIKTHLSNLFDKLGAKSRVEALARAREAELL